MTLTISTGRIFPWQRTNVPPKKFRSPNFNIEHQGLATKHNAAAQTQTNSFQPQSHSALRTLLVPRLGNGGYRGTYLSSLCGVLRFLLTWGMLGQDRITKHSHAFEGLLSLVPVGEVCTHSLYPSSPFFLKKKRV